MKIIVILVLVLAASTALAADKPVRVETTQIDPAQEKATSRALSPMMMEIQAAQESARLQIAELKLRYEAETNDQSAMEIMREVARVKRGARVEMMRIQLRYARQEGHDEAAAKLEEVISRMTTPPVKVVPVPHAGKQQ